MLAWLVIGVVVFFYLNAARRASIQETASDVHRGLTALGRRGVSAAAHHRIMEHSGSLSVPDGVTRRSLLLFVAMSVIWGIPYLFIRIAVSDLNPAVLVFARTGIGALILLPIALARSELRGLAQELAPAACVRRRGDRHSVAHAGDAEQQNHQLAGRSC